ncbi:VOC family protein [Flavihumibacter petaseus]|uniref:VOC domain-containing protein n=1 Tax=Flavihumibacter petaseus NBRC 106054 TaxID=1220578 RepID=A0A0E9N1B4_9BACT|nr:VOC family protein [Flavihumibacter petaseus]GAO43533.1 hypothetical protein FPE01S_02_06380 [Flavihumibacter petaseus NBRC 106054]
MHNTLAMSQDHPTFGNGKICYLEIPSRDALESADFYEKVLGWHIRKRGDGEISFDDSVMEVSGTWRTDRKPVSGLGLLVHFMVVDIGATMALVEVNGGKIVQPVDVEAPEITARFTDPSGNLFGLYQHGG